MDWTDRQARCTAELEALRAVESQSTILTIETGSNQLDQAELHFLGRGLSRDISANANPTEISSHDIELRLPMSFPDSPPDIRWRTPIFHPNVSWSGFVSLREIDIEWTADQNLVAVVERLWDVARCAFMNLNYASNHAARNWFEKQRDFELPVDVRPLRDKVGLDTARTEQSGRRGEILFIGEDTPTSAVPIRIVSASSPRFAKGDNVLYIGDE